jgi:hypothetical protein
MNKQTELIAAGAAHAKPTKGKFDQWKTIELLLDEANRGQNELMKAFGAAVLIAIQIGRALLRLKAFVEHGKVQEVIVERFCKPNNVGIRTAERYQAIARNAELLVQAIRAGTPELADKSDDEILKTLSINKAHELIKQLVKIEDGQELAIALSGPKPDANGWHTPEPIVSMVLDLLKVIDLDPAAIPESNPFSAVTTVSAPSNGLASETPWKGRLWINPGLNKVSHAEWTERLLSEYKDGNVEEGVVLLPACTNSKYASLLRDFPRAFTNKPLIVAGPTLPKLMLKVPLMLVYVGPETRFKDFVKVFSESDMFDVFVPARS